MSSQTKFRAQFLCAALATLVLFFCSQTVAAQAGCTSADFTVPQSFNAALNVGFPATSYAVADLNGDGKLDLAVTESAGSRVAVFLNDGSGWFGAPTKYIIGIRPSAVVAFDFNGDSRPDLAITNEQDGKVSVLLNSGAGLFGPTSNFGTGVNPRALAVGDFNGDGKADLAVGNLGNNDNGSVSILLGDGAGSFIVSPGAPSIAGGVNSLAVADFNSDGKRDLIAGTFNGFFLLLGNGAGGFAAPVEVYDPGGSGVTSADVNGDGKSDLIIGANGLVILLGVGNGAFSPPAVFAHEGGGSIASVTVGDVDGDGKLDVATSASSPGGVSFFKGDGAGAFAPTRNYLATNEMFAIALGDLDSDGDVDMVAGNSVLKNIGGGVFEAPRAVYTVFNLTGGFSSPTPFDLALGDYNGDGRSDLAVLHRGNDSQSARIAILLRDASGNFAHSSSIVYSAGTSLQAIVSSDFNEDGRADIAVTASISSPFSHVVSVSLSNGDGTFVAPHNVILGFEPYDVETGDFNNDGNADLIVAGRNDNLRVVLGNGAGGFFAFVFGPGNGASISRLAAADLNGDAKLDVAITDYFGRRVLTLLGDGAGFTTVRTFDLAASPTAVAIRDFNSDGKPDLAVTTVAFSGGSSDDGRVSVLLGDGTGNFGIPANYPVGAQPESVVSADFDGDGKLDLAVANQFSSSISVLSGDGNGIFRGTVNFNIYGGPGQLGVDDFNSDGRPDLAVPLFGPRAVGLVYGKPPTSEPCIFADDLIVNEGDTPATFEVTVRLSHASGSVVKVSYLIKGDAQAVEGQDFTGGTGTVTFQPGETTKTVPVTILGDLIDEDQETITLNLFGALNARISDGVAKIGIVDNDPPPNISINDVTVTEGDLSSVTATFTVSLSGPTSHSVTVNYQVASGTAIVSEDLDSTSGSLFFGPGQTTRTISVTVRGDLKFEPDENFFVNLSNAVDATIGDGQGLGTILNNDPIPGLTISDAFATEGAGVDTSMTVTVRISNPSYLPVSVDFATADGTAAAGSDYVASTGTVTFAPGETQKTFTITVKDDSIDEASETFSINLSNPSNATIADGQAVGTIGDNDGPSLSINDISIQEGSDSFTFPVSATFTITLSAPSPQMVFVRFGTAEGTATANVDYQTVTNRFIAIPAGVGSITTSVSLIGDSMIEGNETFFVNLSQPTDCTIADGQGIGTIIDDDVTSVQFTTDAIEVDEAAGIVHATVQRVGDLTQGFAANYATGDGSASARSDYNAAAGTLHFGPGETSKTISVFITDDVLTENPEQFLIFLSGPGGGRTNSPSVLTVTITGAETPGLPNPIDNSDFFVRQHYRDFLNRDPDASGLAFWTDQIESCGTDVGCREIKRINVSAAFFLSIEFQETGYFVYRAYKAAYGDTTSPTVPGTVPIIRLNEFSRDSQRVGQGVQVGIGDWQQRLEDNKNSYLLEFIQQTRFLSAFPTTMTGAEFIAKLDLRAGGVLSAEEQAELIAILGDTPSEPTRRAAVLRKVLEDSDLNRNELNRAFVLMQYYGYLRRNPNDQPNVNFSGWKFWLDKLNEFGGNFVAAEMVKAFLLSGEYRGRFGN